ncbi:MAG: 50S ribosomal protein L11 methyltransferase, partial [Pseudomonadota bacterium]
MYQITARGPRAPIETAWDHLAWSDPSPASAVDAKEDGRLIWRLDAYAEDERDARACVAMIQDVSPELNPVVDALEPRDWVTLSLEGLPPVEAGRFIVAGSHALTETAPGKTDILIEAGPALGTGHHGT